MIRENSTADNLLNSYCEIRDFESISCLLLRNSSCSRFGA